MMIHQTQLWICHGEKSMNIQSLHIIMMVLTVSLTMELSGHLSEEKEIQEFTQEFQNARIGELITSVLIIFSTLQETLFMVYSVI